MESRPANSPPGARSWESIWRGPGLAVALALACYANSLANGFTYDDIPAVRDNPRIHNPFDLHAIWLTDWWQIPTERQPLANPGRDLLYRPLVVQSFALNYALHGLQPFGYHLVNVVLHALATALVWLATLRLSRAPALAAVVALLFSVHPVHTEAVANIVGRADVLGGLFLIAGIAVLAKRIQDLTPTRCALAALAFLAALCSKEIAVCYPLVALATVIFVARRDNASIPRNGWLSRGALLAAPLPVYFTLRIIAVGPQLARREMNSLLFNPLIDANLPERIWGALTVFGHYVRLILFPAELSADYGLAVVDPASGPDAMSLVGLVGAILLALTLARWRSPAPQAPLAAWGVVVFAASYVLISNTILLIGVTVAERLIYFGSFPLLVVLCATAAHALPRRPDATRALTALLAIVILVGGVRTTVRNPAWADNHALFARDAASTRSAHLNEGAAGIRLRQAQEASDPVRQAALLKEAEIFISRALAIKQNYPEALRRLGTLYLLRGDRERAIQTFELTRQLNPGDERAVKWLAEARGAKPELRARIDALRDTLRNQPDNLDAHLALVATLEEFGESFQALEAARAASQRFPEEPRVLAALARTLIRNQQHPAATEVAQRWFAAEPTNWRAPAMLAGLYGESNPTAALRYARQAHQLAPDELQTNVNLAEALHLNGASAEALAIYNRLLQNLPPNHRMIPALQARRAELQSE